MTMKGYKIKIENTTELRDSRACDIAFQAGKDCCGLGFYKNGITELYVYGKFSDYVRVYSALRNNGFVIADREEL